VIASIAESSATPTLPKLIIRNKTPNFITHDDEHSHSLDTDADNITISKYTNKFISHIILKRGRNNNKNFHQLTLMYIIGNVRRSE